MPYQRYPPNIDNINNMMILTSILVDSPLDGGGEQVEDGRGEFRMSRNPYQISIFVIASTTKTSPRSSQIFIVSHLHVTTIKASPPPTLATVTAT